MYKDEQDHRRQVRVLEINGDHMPTLIRLGYEQSPAPPDYKSLLHHQMPIRDDKDATVFRRWRTKKDAVTPPGYADSWKINVGEVEATGRQAKNNSYNGFSSTQFAQAFRLKTTYAKKFKKKWNLCQKITSKCTESFKDYCYHSTLHGLRYIGDTSMNFLETCFWIFSIISAIMGAAFFIWKLYNKYSIDPIIISRSSESVSISEFPFPAITVCNMNNAKKSVALGIVHGNDSLQKFYLDDICDFQDSSLTYNETEVSKDAGDWENIYQFLLNVSQSCPQMLYYCRWAGNDTNCTELFDPVLTDEGLCCRFNSLPDVLYDPRKWENLDVIAKSLNHIDWNPEYKMTKADPLDALPRRAFGSGADYGMTLALDVNADEYFCSTTASVGFKLMLHSPVEMPQIKDFALTISPGKETRVIITPHITDSDLSITKIPFKIRRCYFIAEKKLRYYKIYTQRNCVLECEANFTLRYCQCMEYYMPVPNDTRICGKNDDPCTDVARKFMKNKMYEDEDSRSAYNITELPSCMCYPGCNEINYKTEISHSMLMTTFKVERQYYKNNDKYFEKNIAIVHIFFMDTSYTKYRKNIIYGFSELLSNTGGLLGLFLGFSLLSVVEIFYFCARLLWRICKIMLSQSKSNKSNNQVMTKKHDAVYPFAQ